MAKVSVIIPIYNVEKYLKKCVRSVQNQTEQDIEIILVDDGSPDTCGQICDDFAKEDSRIRVIHKENGGLGDARNAGLAVATSKYILFVDSDDSIEPDLISTVYPVAEEQNAQMVVFNFHAVSEEGDEVYFREIDLPQNTLISATETPKLLIMTPSACNKLLRRDWLLQNHFAFPKRIWFEDLCAFSKVFCNVSRAYYINSKPLYNYLQRENSIMSNKNAKKTVEDRITVIESVFTHYKEIGQYDAFENELSWILIYHGFFLLCREILHMVDDFRPYMTSLKTYLDKFVSNPYKNPYISSLTKKEKLLFHLFYGQHFKTIDVMFKLLSAVKSGRQ